MHKMGWAKAMWLGAAFLAMPEAAHAESRIGVGAQPQVVRARLDFKIVIPKVAGLQLGSGSRRSEDAPTTRRNSQRGDTFAQSATNAGDVSLVVHHVASDKSASRSDAQGHGLQRVAVYTLALP